MENVTDYFYIRQVKSGNIRYFAFLVDKYKSKILTVISKIIGDRTEAEDIMQEVFIKAFNSLEQYKEEAEFSTWLYRIAYNTTISELRKRKITFVPIEDNFNGLNESIKEDEEEFSKEEKLIALDKALKKLPPDESFLVSLYYLDKQSIEKVSEISGISPSNVKVKLYRIRKKMAVEINKILHYENR